MAWQSMYPTEASMRGVTADVQYDLFGEITGTQSAINSGTLNNKDKKTAQDYLQLLLGQAKEAGAPAGQPKGQTMFTDFSPVTGAVAAEQNAMYGDSVVNTEKKVSEGIGGWIDAKLGDISSVVLGVVVIGIALVVASTSARKLVVESVKGAALGA